MHSDTDVSLTIDFNLNIIFMKLETLKKDRGTSNTSF